MKKLPIYILLILFVAGITIESKAQQAVVGVDKKKIEWGFRLSENFDGLSQSTGNDLIQSNMKSVMLLGSFVQLNKTELSLDLGYNYAGGEVKYKFYRNWTLIAGGSFAEHWFDIEHKRLDNYYSYTDGEVNVLRYYLGAGYHNTFWQRLKLQVNAKIGGVNTGKATATGIISSYDYYYNTNKKALKTDAYQLSPSVGYGANLYLEMLPRPSKNRVKPLVPFFNLNIMGNARGNTKREISIEEWIPGNIVYYEKSDQIKYDLLSLQVQFGVKWYLSKITQTKE